MDNIISVQYPEVALVKQKLHKSAIPDVSYTVLESLKSLPLEDRIKPGQTVAVAVGSRGIHRIDTVVLHCLKFLMSKGLKPFIVPAMGSHGGATPDGQLNVLAKLGITEEGMGAKIIADMDVTEVGRLSSGTRIYFSRYALQADHFVVINRVKPHTKFRADIESGLCKMLTIIQTAGLDSILDARMVRIKDTASLALLQVSAALGAEVTANPKLEQLTPWGPIEFYGKGNLRALSRT